MLRPCYLPRDPSSRTTYVAGEVARCDLRFPDSSPFGAGRPQPQPGADVRSQWPVGRRLGCGIAKSAGHLRPMTATPVGPEVDTRISPSEAATKG